MEEMLKLLKKQKAFDTLICHLVILVIKEKKSYKKYISDYRIHSFIQYSIFHYFFQNFMYTHLYTLWKW